MKEPTLVILAAGIGSRFGGLKQVTPVDDYGHSIIDFSLYDAYRAGFRNVVFVIKHEIEEDFKDRIGRRIEKYFNVEYVYQQLDILPKGYNVPEGRVKPWGTGHAVMCCTNVVEGPFAVINSDDFYGPTAYQALYDFMASEQNENEHAMVAYLLRNTVTANGTVSRGICSGENGYLTDVVERTKIEKRGSDGAYTEDDITWVPVSGDALVSMNCWAFSNSMMKELKSRFASWLDDNLKLNPLKCEYYLPFVVNETVKSGQAAVRLLNCAEVWHGITYKEDLSEVISAISDMRKNGIYPNTLLD